MRAKLIILLWLAALPALGASVTMPGTNLVYMPVGSYSNSTPYFMGTWNNNPYAWELFDAAWNNFKYMSNSFHSVSNQLTGGPGGAQTPWTSDIEASNKSLTNLNTLTATNITIPINPGASDRYVFSYRPGWGGLDRLKLTCYATLTAIAFNDGIEIYDLDASTNLTASINSHGAMSLSGPLTVGGLLTATNGIDVGSNSLHIANSAAGTLFTEGTSQVMRFGTNSITALVPIYGDAAGLTNIPYATNCITNSLRSPVIVSNVVSIAASGTNILGWVTNLAGVDYSITLGVPKLLFSYDGTTWVSGSTRLVTNTEVRIAFRASDQLVGGNPIPVPMPASVTNVVVYAMNTPSSFGTTNALYGAKLFLGEPQTPTEAATKGYVDDVFSGTAWWSAGTAVQINGYDLNMSSLWSLTTSTADTNRGTFHLKYLGESVLTASQSNAVNVTGLSLAVDGTNIVATLATNGLSSEPRLQFTHLLTPLNWYWLTNTPAIVTTNYVWTFPFPYADSGFLVSMLAPTNLATVAVSGHLTATGVFSGNGSGLTNLPAGAVVSGTFDAARIPVVSEAAHATNADLATRATASTSSTNFYGVLASTNLPAAYVAPQSAHATNADVAAFVSGTLTNSITGNAATATTAASGGTSAVMCGGIATLKFSTTAAYAPTWGSGTVTYNTTEASGSCPTVYLSSRIGTNLNIKISPAPSAGTNVVFTVMTNGVATALTATIVASATTGNSGTTSCVFPASGTTSLKILGNNSTAGAATIYWWNMEVR